MTHVLLSIPTESEVAPVVTGSDWVVSVIVLSWPVVLAVGVLVVFRRSAERSARRARERPTNHPAGRRRLTDTDRRTAGGER